MTVPGDSLIFFYYPGTNDLLAEADNPVDGPAAMGVKLVYLGYLNFVGTIDRVGDDGITPASHVLRRARGRVSDRC